MKKLPVGQSDFRKVIDENYYFVDKSLFIKEIIDRPDDVLLIPRPRRFGKTLNMSMIKYFYGCNIAPAIGKTDPDNEHLFTDLNISKAGKEYTEKQGKYPVIFLTFKDIKDQDFETSFRKIANLIAKEYKNNIEVFNESELDRREQGMLDSLLNAEPSKEVLSNSLIFLMEKLAKHYNQRVILLIDEYDSPIHASFVNGFYDDMINFMRNFLSAGLKDTSEYLEKSIITGIIRVAPESIFSGLNNLSVFTILHRTFSSYFGFTGDEVKSLMKDQSCNDNGEISRWYNGYEFGDKVIYNPWSIINYISRFPEPPKPYWVNTSQNEIVDQLLRNGGHELKKEIEILLSGESIERVIQDDIVFSEIFSNDRMLWSFILMGGYLKHECVKAVEENRIYRLMIPNLEVKRTFTKILDNYFQEATDYNKIEEMLTYLKKGDVRTFGKLFRKVVKSLFSYHDFGNESEKVYHAFTAGLLVWLSGEYEVKSNRESGYGRYDIMLIPTQENLPGFVIEFKKVDEDEDEDIEKATEEAVKQITEKQYETELIDRDVKEIHKVAIVFEGKHVEVTEIV